MTISSDCYEKSGDGRVPADFRCDEPMKSGSCYVLHHRHSGEGRNPVLTSREKLSRGNQDQELGPGLRRDDGVTEWPHRISNAAT
jgi:hypothetical protein